MTDADTEVWDELRVTMYGAVQGQHDAQRLENLVNDRLCPSAGAGVITALCVGALGLYSQYTCTTSLVLIVGMDLATRYTAYRVTKWTDIREAAAAELRRFEERMYELRAQAVADYYAGRTGCPDHD